MLILASSSPRRREILVNAGIPHRIAVPQGVDESVVPGEHPDDYVRRLAREKADAVNKQDSVVLAADTSVVLDGEILGKPEHPDDAARMLRLLSGREHSVITGICIQRGEARVVDLARSQVRFAALADSEIAAYVATGEPMDKAGAYGIQGLASKFVERIEGCYFNIMGLPIALVYRHLRDREWIVI